MRDALRAKLTVSVECAAGGEERLIEEPFSLFEDFKTLLVEL
jgi:hypothetical protein